MNAEKSTMDDKGVFNPAPVQKLPSGKKAIGLHWVFVWKDTDTVLGTCQMIKDNSHERRSAECVGFGEAISNVTLELKP